MGKKILIDMSKKIYRCQTSTQKYAQYLESLVKNANKNCNDITPTQPLEQLK